MSGHDDGWVAITAVTASEAAVVADDCAAALAALGDVDRRTGDKPAAGTHRLVDAAARVPSVAALLERAPLRAAVAARAGVARDDLPLPEVTFRAPTPGHGGQKLHADALPRSSAASVDRPPEVVTAIVALVDFAAEIGATRVVPGSHRRPDLQLRAQHDPDGLERAVGTVHLVGPAGTAFVFSGHLLHAGSTNDGKRPRAAVQACWRFPG